MDSHKHKVCEHETGKGLKYCKTCDLVYCDLCRREWHKPVENTYTWAPPKYVQFGDIPCIQPTITSSVTHNGFSGHICPA